MTRRNSISLKVKVLWSLAVFGIVIGLILSMSPGESVVAGAKNSDDPVSVLDQLDPTTRNQILRAATGSFQPSLEMKENVDFLLTPALLVQQVMSEDIVITYPSE